MSKFPNIDIETIKTFLIVAYTKNFTDSSEILHRTPAAVSYRIRVLESQLGLKLFKRLAHGLELLPTGEYLVEQLTSMTHHLENITQQLHLIDTGIDRRYCVGIGSFIGSEYQALLARSLAEIFPRTEFCFHRADQLSLLQGINEGAIKIIVGLLSRYSPSAGFKQHFIDGLNWSLISIMEASNQGKVALLSDAEGTCCVESSKIDQVFTQKLRFASLQDLHVYLQKSAVIGILPGSEQMYGHRGLKFKKYDYPHPLPVDRSVCLTRDDDKSVITNFLVDWINVNSGQGNSFF